MYVLLAKCMLVEQSSVEEVFNEKKIDLSTFSFFFSNIK